MPVAPTAILASSYLLFKISWGAGLRT
jgi:hypothetical protein